MKCNILYYIMQETILGIDVSITCVYYIYIPLHIH